MNILNNIKAIKFEVFAKICFVVVQDQTCEEPI